MDANTLMTLISSVGFPIVACIGCGWYINKKDGEHKDEISKITEALNNNTIVIQKLVDKFDNIEGR